MMNYTYALKSAVVNASVANEWEDAVKEWRVGTIQEDDDCSESCVCGKQGIRYLFDIDNIKNGKTLFPIGRCCIHKFEQEELDIDVDIKLQMLNLYKAFDEGKFVTLSKEFFSRKLLKYQYENDAFNNSYNNYMGTADYEFMCKMFNKKNKNSITQKQNKKIVAIILQSIKPFVMTWYQGYVVDFQNENIE